MEQDWTKKRVAELLTDEGTLNRWLDDFTEPVYTWMYYQVNADAELATELTAKTFTAAMSNLSSFDPTAEAMYQWLKDLAKQTRDEVLIARQMKPQRPWAWSQLPDDVLCAMANFRGEPLPEEVANNICVQELTQAALVEMGRVDRELMKHRYNHLDTPENIAEEIGESIEQVNDRLYRCRHFFRRVLVQLIQSENVGFTESTAAGELELLDTNLEKLLSATAMYQPISNLNLKTIRDAAARTAASQAALQTPARSSHAPILCGAVVGIVVLAVATVLIMARAPKDIPPTEPTDPTARITDEKSGVKKQVESDKIDQEELRKVLTLGQAGNLSGLLQILKDGQFESQFAASHFIGMLGDESAIGLLQEAAQRWYPNGPDDNVFAQAIIKIEDRLLAASGEMVEEPEIAVEPEAETDTAESATAKTEPADEKPNHITGIVTNPNQSPVPGAEILLTLNTLMGQSPGQSILGRTNTDQQGRYTINANPQEPVPVFVDCNIQSGLTLNRRKSLLYQKDAATTVDFVSFPLIEGNLNLTDQPSDNQILYLSDALDPANASFRCETVTDKNNRFSFHGIPNGSYYLLYNTPDNRIVVLDTIDMTGGNIVDWNVDIPNYNLTVKYDQPEETPLISQVVLTYGPDVSSEFQQFELTTEDDETFLTTAPEGSYTLITTFVNDMQLHQDIDLTADRTLTVEIPKGNISLAGRFTTPSPLDFFLESTDQKLRIDLIPEDSGLYAVGRVPPESYTLNAMVNNLLITFLELDFEENGAEETLYIDPARWMQSFSPLYVIVTDEAGNLINNAQVWLTGDGEIITARSTGRGAFLAAPAGQYALHAAYPGRPAAEKVVTIQQQSLLAAPNPGNTVTLQIP